VTALPIDDPVHHHPQARGHERARDLDPREVTAEAPRHAVVDVHVHVALQDLRHREHARHADAHDADTEHRRTAADEPTRGAIGMAVPRIRNAVVLAADRSGAGGQAPRRPVREPARDAEPEDRLDVREAPVDGDLGIHHVAALLDAASR